MNNLTPVAPNSVTDPIPVGPGVIAHHPDRDLTSEECDTETLHKILVYLRMYDRELQSQPEDVGNPSYTLARFRRVFTDTFSPFSDLVESVTNRHDAATKALYAGAGAIWDAVHKLDGQKFNDDIGDLENLRDLFNLVQPPMVASVHAALDAKS